MKKINYFFSSFFGFVPGFFIFNTIGAGLSNYIEKNEEFSFLKLILTSEIYFPILMFIGLIILSFIVKKKYFKNVN
jgi:biotin transporter BioY